MARNQGSLSARACAVSVLAAAVVSGGCVRDKIWRKAYAEQQPEAMAASLPDHALGGPYLGHVAIDGEIGSTPVQDQPLASDAQPNPVLDAYGRPTSGLLGAAEQAHGRAFGFASATQASFAMQGSDFDPDISPDGSRIAYASTQHDKVPNIYIKDVGGLAVTQVTSGPASEVMPAFSPDGQRVAFASNRNGNWDIYVVPVTGGNPVQITTGPANELHPSWSPDGENLVFCRLGLVSGEWEMWVTETANTGVRHFIGYGLFPEWRPVEVGGKGTILFQRSRSRGDHAFTVWTIDYKDGQPSSPTEVASSPTASCINPTWSRDGEWIVYASIPNGDGPSAASSGLVLASLDGHGRVNLTAGAAQALMPVWGARSDVFYVSDRSGVENIWKIDASSAILAATGNGPAAGTAVTSVNEHTGH